MKKESENPRTDVPTFNVYRNTHTGVRVFVVNSFCVLKCYLANWTCIIIHTRGNTVMMVARARCYYTLSLYARTCDINILLSSQFRSPAAPLHS